MDRDLWCICYDSETDLFLLKNQIQSLITFKNSLDYNIIINEENSKVKHVRKCLKKMGIITLLKTANFKFQIWKATDFVKSSEMFKNGYVNQQILKLHVHRQSKFKEHVILDTQQILISYDAYAIFHPKGHVSEESVIFKKTYIKYCRLWHNNEHIPVRPSTTPYLFKSNILIALEKSFKKRSNYIDHLQDFNISEFALYNLFEQMYDPNYKEIIGYPMASTLWLPDENGSYKKSSNNEITVAIHSKSVNKIGKEKYMKIISKIINQNKYSFL